MAQFSKKEAEALKRMAKKKIREYTPGKEEIREEKVDERRYGTVIKWIILAVLVILIGYALDSVFRKGCVSIEENMYIISGFACLLQVLLLVVILLVLLYCISRWLTIKSRQGKLCVMWLKNRK